MLLSTFVTGITSFPINKEIAVFSVVKQFPYPLKMISKQADVYVRNKTCYSIVKYIL